MLQTDVDRLNQHKGIVMDWLYTEMSEHSKKLELYAKWFEATQSGLSLE